MLFADTVLAPLVDLQVTPQEAMATEHFKALLPAAALRFHLGQAGSETASPPQSHVLLKADLLALYRPDQSVGAGVLDL